MKSKRQHIILEIIQQTEIDTQEELLRMLSERGFNVTQATISRDIKDMRLIKTLGPDGRYRYAAPRSELGDLPARFNALFAESVLNVDTAMNTLVIRCEPGMAQAVCAALDNMHWTGLVGTLAGEDTIFALFKTIEHSGKAQTKLQQLLYK